jgi:hypothetical protein
MEELEWSSCEECYYFYNYLLLDNGSESDFRFQDEGLGFYNIPQGGDGTWYYYTRKMYTTE